VSMDTKLLQKKLSAKLRQFIFSSNANGAQPTTVEMANALLERDKFQDLLPYRDFDEETDLVFTDNGHTPYAGFGYQLSPLLLGGADTENQLDAFIQKLPPDSVVQFTTYSSPSVFYYLDAWSKARINNAPTTLLKTLAERRRDYMLKSSTDFSLLPEEELRPRVNFFNCFVNIPFKGDYTNSKELEQWLKIVVELKLSLSGTLGSIGLNPRIMKEQELHSVIRYLLNPQFKTTYLDKNDNLSGRFGNNLVEESSRIYETEEGNIRFTKAGESKKPCVSCLTIDNYPDHLQLFQMASLIGAPKSRDERISMPFYMYTNIHVLDADKSAEDLTKTLAMLNKQTMSDSEWYKSMMQHLFVRLKDTQNLIDVSRKGRTLVRMYTGINLYSNEEDVKLDSEYVAGLWRKYGFRVSRESFIALPVFVNSLPFAYDAMSDKNKSGIQRAVTCHSLNAATAVPIQGDWSGTNPAEGGPLFISRRGTLASIDIFSSNTNYNFCTIATSGAGKSYLNQEFVADMLSRGGKVRVFDVGRSYARLAEILDGENMIFDPRNPRSLNCFWGIETEEHLKEILPFLKDIFRLMAYPRHDIPAWEYQALENCIMQSWYKYKGKLETIHLYEWLMEKATEKNDTRYSDIAFQIRPHAKGRYKAWFNGPRELKFTKAFTIIELEELSPDPELKTLVLTLAANEIANEFYMSERSTQKVCLIDEGWDLLANPNTTSFIERLFRTARKYNAAIGLITQSYGDFNVSPAAKAAIENSAWKFNLYQKSDSIQAAKEAKKIPDDPFFYDLISSIKPGVGFSELFVDHEIGKSAFRFTVDPHTHFTYTTNPKDLKKMEALEKQGFTIEETINTLAEDDLKERGIL